MKKCFGTGKNIIVGVLQLNKYFIFFYFLFPRIIALILPNLSISCVIPLSIALELKFIYLSFAVKFCNHLLSVRFVWPANNPSNAVFHCISAIVLRLILCVCFFPVFSANFRTCDILRMHAMCHIKDSHSFSCTLCTHIHTRTRTYKHK